MKGMKGMKEYFEEVFDAYIDNVLYNTGSAYRAYNVDYILVVLSSAYMYAVEKTYNVR